MEYLPIDKLVGVAENIDLDRFAGAFENIDPSRFEKLAENLSADKLKTLTQGFDSSTFERLAEKVPKEKLDSLKAKFEAGDKRDLLERIANRLDTVGSLKSENQSDESEPEETVVFRAVEHTETPSVQRGDSRPPIETFLARAGVEESELSGLDSSKLFKALKSANETEAEALFERLSFSQLNNLTIFRFPPGVKKKLLEAHRNKVLNEPDVSKRQQLVTGAGSPVTRMTFRAMKARTEMKQYGGPNTKLPNLYMGGIQKSTPVTEILSWYVQEVPGNVVAVLPDEGVRALFELLSDHLSDSDADGEELVRFMGCFKALSTDIAKLVNDSPHELNTLLLLNGFKDLYDQGKLSYEAYSKILYMSIAQKPQVEPMLAIHLIPDLLKHPVHSRWATETLEALYSGDISVERTVPTAFPGDLVIEQASVPELFSIPSIDAMLGKRTIQDDWVDYDSGSPIDIGRLTRRVAPYELQEGGEDRPLLVMVAQKGELEVILSEVLDDFPELLMPGTKGKSVQVLYSIFVHSLLSYQGKINLQAIIPQKLNAPGYLASRLKSGQEGHLHAGRYGADGAKIALLGRVHSKDFVRDQNGKNYYKLDPARVMDTIDEPEATFVDRDLMKQYVAEFCQQITSEFMYERVFGVKK
ncbi:hypothetical protein [Endozoicomonas arenosclerae]|uniref:hypothetical protein n=1 Tax=Endozoicomonas arenosclerae TaxID=1633495 RepID=UPI0007860CE9|nr:hypothetical protein [Endozoicomonas arenosclerae]